MSSSGKGQSKIDGPDDVAPAWEYAMSGSRVRSWRHATASSAMRLVSGSMPSR